MYKIKFGTDGWRDIIADQFTSANVRRVAMATALWLRSKSSKPSCVVGHDCRFGGEMFAKDTAAVLASKGIKVILAQDFVSTPMVSLATKTLNATAGIVLTASHNPPEYNGFKIKASYGGPATPAEITQIESLIPDNDVLPFEFDSYVDQGLIIYEDLEQLYIDHINASFNSEALIKVDAGVVYDAMFGAGRNTIKRILPNATLLHCDNNPGFDGRAPEPILKNLPEMAELIAKNKHLLCGLATDGDADRIGFFDEEGKFVDSHNLILLLIQYLTDYKGYTGKVVKSFSVSDKVQKLCDLKGIQTITTKIGFKYICEYMITDDVLVGAEESGGIAIKGHIPERDGIWMGLVIMEYMAQTGKKVSELLQDIYAQIGTFAVERYDLHLDEYRKNRIVDACANNQYKNFNNLQIESTENIDGFKFRLGNEEWVMIRPSGTEPVLRVYAEAESSVRAFEILEIVKKALLG